MHTVCFIRPIDRTLPGATTLVQSGPGSNDIAIRLFNVISRTFVGGVLPLCRDAVGVFYSPGQIDRICIQWKYLIPYNYMQISCIKSEYLLLYNCVQTNDNHRLIKKSVIKRKKKSCKGILKIVLKKFSFIFYFYKE